MDKSEIIFLIGIIIALVWLGLCILIGDKKRKYTIIIGIIIDVILFIICKSYKMLLIGILGGLVFSLIPNFINRRKYDIAINLMNDKKSFVIVSIIFFVMVFMVLGITFLEFNM